MAAVTEGDCFFLVWCEPEVGAWHTRTPSKQHRTFADALDEAKRLGRIHRGTRFFVVKAVGFAESVDVRTAMLTDRDEMPF